MVWRSGSYQNEISLDKSSIAAMRVSLLYVEQSLDSSNQWRPWCEHSSKLLTDTTVQAPEVDGKWPVRSHFTATLIWTKVGPYFYYLRTNSCNTPSIPLWKNVNIEFPEHAQLSSTALLCKLKNSFSLSSWGHRVCTDTWVWIVKRKRKCGRTKNIQNCSLSDSTLQQPVENSAWETAKWVKKWNSISGFQYTYNGWLNC